MPLRVELDVRSEWQVRVDVGTRIGEQTKHDCFRTLLSQVDTPRYQEENVTCGRGALHVIPGTHII
jgi:hypothetical protein